jgi:hypothetical protein
MPESTDRSIKEMKVRIQNDLFWALAAEN